MTSRRRRWLAVVAGATLACGAAVGCSDEADEEPMMACGDVAPADPVPVGQTGSTPDEALQAFLSGADTGWPIDGWKQAASGTAHASGRLTDPEEVEVDWVRFSGPSELPTGTAVAVVQFPDADTWFVEELCAPDE